ncbi:MAG: hypothetical protein NVS1B4_26630 [Gemmatimonadaceae bacterium]
MADKTRTDALKTALQELLEQFARDIERNVKRRIDQSSPSGAGEVVGASTRAAIARLADVLAEPHE